MAVFLFLTFWSHLLPVNAQDQGAIDPKELSRLFGDLDSAEESSRLDAFEKLRSQRDPQIETRLKKTLASLSDQASRKAIAERARVLKNLVAARRKALDVQALAGRQKELFRLLQAGDTATMGPLVRDLWEKFYINPFSSEEDEQVALTQARSQQLARFTDTVTNEGKPVAEDGFKELLRSTDEDHVILAMPEKDQKVVKANAAIRGQTADEEYRCMFLTNLYRVLLGKNALRINVKLIAAARDHSKDMKEFDFFDHESPVAGKKTPFDRAARQGTKARAENIAKGYASGELVFWGWFNSLGHHRNMMIDCTEIGVGSHETWWTEMFGG